MAKKTKRRNKGSGSEIFLAKKERWRCSVEVNGHKVEATARTLAEARKKLEKSARGMISGEFGELSPTSRVTELISHYIAQRENDGKATSRESSANILNLYVAPHIGSLRIDRVTSANISRMIRELKDSGGRDSQGLGDTTIGHAVKQARAIFEWARKRDLLKINPASPDFVKAPTADRRSRAMTQDEWLEVKKNYSNEYLKVAMNLSVLTGLRRGELLALTWDDLKLNGKEPTLTVNGTISRTKRNGLNITLPKTKSSRRTLVIDPELAKELLQHQKEQDQKKREVMSRGESWGQAFPKHRLIFTNGIGNPIEGNKFGSEIKRITMESGIGSWSPHLLRHTCASFAIAGGVQMKELSEMLGHSSIMETGRTYIHLYQSASVETSRKIADYAKGKTI